VRLSSDHAALLNKISEDIEALKQKTGKRNANAVLNGLIKFWKSQENDERCEACNTALKLDEPHRSDQATALSRHFEPHDPSTN